MPLSTTTSVGLLLTVSIAILLRYADSGILALRVGRRGQLKEMRSIVDHEALLSTVGSQCVRAQIEITAAIRGMRHRHPAQANQQHDANEHDGSHVYISAALLGQQG